MIDKPSHVDNPDSPIEEQSSTLGVLTHLVKIVTRVDTKIDHMYERVADIRHDMMDHEQRLRVLEALMPGKASGPLVEGRLRTLETDMVTIQTSRGTFSWIWQAIWPVGAVVFTALGYFAQKGVGL